MTYTLTVKGTGWPEPKSAAVDPLDYDEGDDGDGEEIDPGAGH